MTICCVIFVACSVSYYIILYLFHISRVSTTNRAYLILFDFHSSEFAEEHDAYQNLINRHCVGM